jgi:hypothetical protein
MTALYGPQLPWQQDFYGVGLSTPSLPYLWSPETGWPSYNPPPPTG